MKTSKYLAISTIAAIIVGCGGGGGGNDNPQTGTAYYKDSGVVGVNYKCGSQSGVTKEEGKFTFEKGADCEFSLADIPLRKIPKSELADNKVIVETDVNVAQLLQSLDVDGNPDNGIQITKEVIEAVKETVAELKIKDPKKIIEDNTTKAIFVSEVAQQVKNDKIKLKPIEEVTKHLEKTKTEVTKALLAGKTFWVVGTHHGHLKFFKSEINKDVTETKITWTVTGEGAGSTDKIKLEGNKIIFLDGETEPLEVIQKEGYILLKSREGELRAYPSEAEAKKYYETLKKETTITEDKIKKAFANKTLYRAKKYKDGTIKLIVVKTTNDEIDYKAYINNKLDTEDSGKVEYTIEGDAIIIKEDNETESLKVTAITDKYIVILDTENDVETWYYSKTDALNNPDIRNHNYENEDNGEGGQAATPNNSLANYIVGKTYYVTADDEDVKSPHVEKLEFKNDGKTLVVSWMEDGELHQHTFTYNIEGNKITLKGDDFTETFYGPIHETKDYIIFGTHDGAFYKTKEAAEAALNKKYNSLENTNSNLVELLAGKTFYLVVANKNDNFLDKISFNEDLTSATLVGLEGQDKGDIFTLNMQVNGDKIIFEDTPDKYRTIYYNPDYSTEYMVVETYDKNGNLIEKAKLFFDENKAREYYNSLQ